MWYITTRLNRYRFLEMLSYELKELQKLTKKKREAVEEE